MVVVKILIGKNLDDGHNFGVHLYENNFDGECVVQDDSHCVADVDGLDDIFGTNDQRVVVRIPASEIAKIIAGQVVDDLLSRGAGNTYDDDMALEYTNDRLADFAQEITDLVHVEMKDKYTTADGFTIIGDDIMDCPHKCGDCIDSPYEGECMHGCHDCGHYDGGNCLHSGSNNFGCYGDQCAADCYEWEGGE